MEPWALCCPAGQRGQHEWHHLLTFTLGLVSVPPGPLLGLLGSPVICLPYQSVTVKLEGLSHYPQYLVYLTEALHQYVFNEVYGKTFEICAHIPCFIALHRYCVFYKLKARHPVAGSWEAQRRGLDQWVLGGAQGRFQAGADMEVKQGGVYSSRGEARNRLLQRQSSAAPAGV